MRILALVPGGIGDQILFFPTLDSLKQAYPKAKLDVVVEPRAKAAYRVCPFVNEEIVFDFKGSNSLADWGNLLGVIRDREYDAVLSLGRSWAVGVLLWLTGVPTRVGYAGSAGAWCLTNPVALKTEQYAASQYHDLLSGLGISGPCPDPRISVPKRDIEWAEAEQKRLGIHESGYVLIHPGASALSRLKGIEKTYPAQSWKSIIRDFRQRQPGLPVVLVQGPEDREIVEAIAADADVKIATPDDIGKLAALIAGANLMLCTDSGPMHLAVAVQTYTIALFGPTDSTKLLPTSSKIIALQSTTNRVADITPDDVLKRVWGG